MSTVLGILLPWWGQAHVGASGSFHCAAAPKSSSVAWQASSASTSSGMPSPRSISKVLTMRSRGGVDSSSSTSSAHVAKASAAAASPSAGESTCRSQRKSSPSASEAAVLATSQSDSSWGMEGSFSSSAGMNGSTGLGSCSKSGSTAYLKTAPTPKPSLKRSARSVVGTTCTKEAPDAAASSRQTTEGPLNPPPATDSLATSSSSTTPRRSAASVSTEP
mmetsp:Transcript_126443/g.393539  ORF Transcript_126443/g.393539 Transcript_126443/m.393539 type:complete len:219 (+) Transcript_126443:70-726(+)